MTSGVNLLSNSYLNDWINSRKDSSGTASDTTAAGNASSAAKALEEAVAASRSSDPAYVLSLGQQDTAKAMVGYGKLATLARQFGNQMTGLERADRRAESSDDFWAIAQTLVDSVNQLEESVAQMLTKDGELAATPDAAENLLIKLRQALQDVEPSGDLASLQDIGIVPLEDGTLGLDAATLQEAAAAAPEDLKAMLTRAIEAVKTTAASGVAADSPIKDELKRLVSLSVRRLSLVDFLGSTGQSSGFTGAESDTSGDSMLSGLLATAAANREGG